MKKREALKLLDSLVRAFQSDNLGWHEVDIPDCLSGFSGEFTDARCLVRDVGPTHLVVGFSVDIKWEGYDCIVGWADSGQLACPEDMARKRRGHIEWHRREMPTEEFSQSEFRRSLGGLVKMGVPKKYPLAPNPEEAIAEVLRDLASVGREYLDIMQKRRFHGCTGRG